MTKEEIVNSLRQIRANLQSWCRNYVHPGVNAIPVAHGNIKPVVGRVKDSILKETNGLESNIRCLRMLTFSTHADLIERNYNELLNTVDTEDPKFLTAIYPHYFELHDSKEAAKGLIETIVDVLQFLEADSTELQNLMAITIIPKYFDVTEKTLRRRTGEGKRFKNYPDAEGTMRLDTTVVARYHPRRTDSQKK